MIDEAVEELAAAREAAPRRTAASRSGWMSPSTPTSPPPMSPSRRRRSTSTGGSPGPGPGELRAIHDELRDRFGPLPREAENLLELQRARIELAEAGAESVEFRGGRLSVTGVELDSEAAEALRRGVDGAIYEWREQTAALRVPGEPEARLGALLALARGLGEAKRASGAAEDMLPAP